MADTCDRNPFANDDGSPIDGKEAEFFNWGIEQAKRRLLRLTPEEQTKQLEADRLMNDKMNS